MKAKIPKIFFYSDVILETSDGPDRFHSHQPVRGGVQDGQLGATHEESDPSACKCIETRDDIDTLCQKAKDAQKPLFCLVGMLEPTLLRDWSNFCNEKHKDLTCLVRHSPSKFCGDEFCLFLINKHGYVIRYNQDWLRYVFSFVGLRQLEILAFFDDTFQIPRVSDLKIGCTLFVYDCECIKSLEQMKTWKCDETHAVIPLSRTGLQFPCLILRQGDELFIRGL